MRELKRDDPVQQGSGGTFQDGSLLVQTGVRIEVYKKPQDKKTQ